MFASLYFITYTEVMCYQRVHVISSIKLCCWEQSDIGDATDVCTLPKFPAAILLVVILNQLHKTIRIRWAAPSKIIHTIFFKEQVINYYCVDLFD